MTFRPQNSLVVMAMLALWAGPSPARADDLMDPPAWLKAGDAVPAVTLHNAAGEAVELRAEVMKQPTVLIFYRGGWCPFCNAHLGALNAIVPDLRAAGYQLIAISPDRPAKLYDAPKRKTKPEYSLLSDQDAQAIDAFKISYVVPEDMVAKYKNQYGIDLEADSGRKHHKLPHPAVYIVDTKGVIRFAHVNPNYKVRMDPKKILEAAKQAAAPMPAM